MLMMEFVFFFFFTLDNFDLKQGIMNTNLSPKNKKIYDLYWDAKPQRTYVK